MTYIVGNITREIVLENVALMECDGCGARALGEVFIGELPPDNGSWFTVTPLNGNATEHVCCLRCLYDYADAKVRRGKTDNAQVAN